MSAPAEKTKTSYIQNKKSRSPENRNTVARDFKRKGQISMRASLLLVASAVPLSYGQCPNSCSRNGICNPLGILTNLSYGKRLLRCT